MKIVGIILIVWGIIGIIIGTMMYGDIGIACIVGAVTSVISGVGFIIAGIKLKKKNI